MSHTTNISNRQHLTYMQSSWKYHVKYFFWHLFKDHAHWQLSFHLKWEVCLFLQAAPFGVRFFLMCHFLCRCANPNNILHFKNISRYIVVFYGWGKVRDFRLLTDFRSGTVSTGLQYTQINQFMAYAKKYCWQQGRSFHTSEVERVVSLTLWDSTVIWKSTQGQEYQANFTESCLWMDCCILVEPQKTGVVSSVYRN